MSKLWAMLWELILFMEVEVEAEEQKLENDTWVEFWNMNKSLPGGEVKAWNGYGRGKEFWTKGRCIMSDLTTQVISLNYNFPRITLKMHLSPKPSSSKCQRPLIHILHVRSSEHCCGNLNTSYTYTLQVYVLWRSYVTLLFIFCYFID